MKLEQIKSIANIVALIALPVITALIGNNYTESIKEREIRSKYVELAINILREDPSGEAKNLREWAVQVINKYSDVEISDETKKDLIEVIPIHKTSESGYKKKLNQISEYSKSNRVKNDTLGQLFLDLAKLGIIEGDIFNAKYTLGSIIENHPNPAIVGEAEKVLSRIENMEKPGNPVNK